MLNLIEISEQNILKIEEMRHHVEIKLVYNIYTYLVVIINCDQY